MQGLTVDDQWRLDLFEGSQYRRVEVRPRFLDENNKNTMEIKTETYVWADDERALEAGEWDFEVFQREKMGRWIGNNDEYEGELRPSICGK